MAVVNIQALRYARKTGLARDVVDGSASAAAVTVRKRNVFKLDNGVLRAHHECLRLPVTADPVAANSPHRPPLETALAGRETTCRERGLRTLGIRPMNTL
jgi:hypothetical protein